MKILFLHHPQFSHCTWYLYEGICRTLGVDSIVEYPHNPIVHGRSYNLHEVQWYNRVHAEMARGVPMPAGIPPLSPGEYLTGGDVRAFSTEEAHAGASYIQQYEYSTFPKQREYDEDEIVATISSFDFVVLGNSHRVPTIALARLRDRCGARMPPIVYVDEGERDEFDAHWAHVFRPALTFKQLLTPQVASEYQGNYVNPRVPVEMVPFPLSNPWVYGPGVPAVIQNQAAEHRPLDLVSYLGPTHDERAIVQTRIGDIVQRRKGLNALTQVVGPSRAYYAIMASSRIGLCMRGSGRDTLRYWEIPALGTAMLCDGTMGVLQPYPFRDGVTARFYRNLDEMEHRLIELHENEAMRAAIAIAGRAHLRKYHSIEARALFFLAIVEQKLGIRPSTDQASSLADWWRSRLGWESALPEWRGETVGYGDN